MNFGLDDKRTLFPPSAMFLKDYEDKSFCSNQLAIHIEDIANRNDINHYSPLNETFMDLDTNVEIFKDYLRANSRIVNCVMIDSYTIVDREEITTGNGERTRYKFLKPINTSDYIIYRYENNFWGFVLFALSFLAILLLSIIGAMLIYYKVILYIVYGNS